MDAIINLGYVNVIFRPQAIKKNSDTEGFLIMAWALIPYQLNMYIVQWNQPSPNLVVGPKLNIYST